MQLDLPQCDYVEADEPYWQQLAQEVSIGGFHFGDYFAKRFGIYALQESSQFYSLWFDNAKRFDRWLIAYHYADKVSEQGYICKVLAQMDDYTTPRFVELLSLHIFSLGEEAFDYLSERRAGMEEVAKRGIALSPSCQQLLEEKLRAMARRDGVATALRFLTGQTDCEKRLIIEWLAEGRISTADLHTLYPDLHHYLRHTEYACDTDWLSHYFDLYKQAKIGGNYSAAIEQRIAEVNASEASFHEWYDRFATVKTLMHGRTDVGVYFWIDGLGLDWVPLIEHIVREREADGYYLNEVLVARAKLPTRTANNKDDLRQLGGVLLEKIGDLDRVAHTVRSYLQYIIDDIRVVRQAVNQVLDAHPKQKIAIVSEHGMSYLPQMVEGRNLKGIDSDHYGRCAACKKGMVADEYYLRTGEGQELVALRHHSLTKKTAEGTGSHGGATPEEVLVPILIISDHKETKHWTAKPLSLTITAANPVFEVAIVGLKSGERPYLTYNNRSYALHPSGNHFTSQRIDIDPSQWRITLTVGSHSEDFEIEPQLAITENDILDI